MNSNEKPSQSYFLERQGKFMRGKKSKENFSIVFSSDKTDLMSHCGHCVWVWTGNKEVGALTKIWGICSVSGGVLFYLSLYFEGPLLSINTGLSPV